MQSLTIVGEGSVCFLVSMDDQGQSSSFARFRDHDHLAVYQGVKVFGHSLDIQRIRGCFVRP